VTYHDQAVSSQLLEDGAVYNPSSVPSMASWPPHLSNPEYLTAIFTNIHHIFSLKVSQRVLLSWFLAIEAAGSLKLVT